MQCNPRVISPLPPAIPHPITTHPVLVVNPSNPLPKLVSLETSLKDKVWCDRIPLVISPLFHVPIPLHPLHLVLVVNLPIPLLKLVSLETSQEDKVGCDLIPWCVTSPLFHVPIPLHLLHPVLKLVSLETSQKDKVRWCDLIPRDCVSAGKTKKAWIHVFVLFHETSIALKQLELQASNHEPPVYVISLENVVYMYAFNLCFGQP